MVEESMVVVRAMERVTVVAEAMARLMVAEVVVMVRVVVALAWRI